MLPFYRVPMVKHGWIFNFKVQEFCILYTINCVGKWTKDEFPKCYAAGKINALDDYKEEIYTKCPSLWSKQVHVCINLLSLTVDVLCFITFACSMTSWKLVYMREVHTSSHDANQDNQTVIVGGKLVGVNMECDLDIIFYCCKVCPLVTVLSNLLPTTSSFHELQF